MVKQLSLRTKVTVVSEHEQECHIFHQREFCRGYQCAFWSTTKLPCHHIFAVWERKKHPLFDPSLPAKCWIKDVYYRKSNLAVEASCSVRNVFIIIAICIYTDFKYWSLTTTFVFDAASKYYIAKILYHRKSNRWDFTTDFLKDDYTLHELRICERPKRKYTWVYIV